MACAAAAARTTSTAYPPPASATSALTGTARTSRACAETMLTETGAWSRFPVAAGWTSRTVIATVSGPLRDRRCRAVWLPAGRLPGTAVATEETTVTTPGVVVTPSGSVTVTWSPGRTRYSWVTGSWAVTTGTVDVAVSTADPGCGGEPRLGVTLGDPQRAWRERDLAERHRARYRQRGRGLLPQFHGVGGRGREVVADGQVRCRSRARSGSGRAAPRQGRDDAIGQQPATPAERRRTG